MQRRADAGAVASPSGAVIRCPWCDALHRVDPGRIAPGGGRARCTRCGRAVIVRRRDAPLVPHVGPLPADGAGRSPEHRPGEVPRPEPLPAPISPTGPSASRRTAVMVLVGLWLGVAGGALLSGLRYYATPLDERPFTELHDRFRPSGSAGLGFGILGSAMMVAGVAMYSVRKRVGWLSRLGKLRYWLEVHIFLCTLGPFLVLLHTSFKVGGLVAIAFWSMTAVVASGIVGRYLYARIPQTLNGQFLSLQAAEHERDRLVEELERRSGISRSELTPVLALPHRDPPRTLPGAVLTAVRLDLAGRARRRRMRRLFRERRVPRAARESLARLVRQQVLRQQQIALLHPFLRVFRYWHLFHLPLALVLFLVMAAHILVAALFGYAWVY